MDVLVNNAGFDRPGGFVKLDLQDFQAVLGVHLMEQSTAVVRALLECSKNATAGS